jgi:hypothetical protein
MVEEATELEVIELFSISANITDKLTVIINGIDPPTKTLRKTTGL